MVKGGGSLAKLSKSSSLTVIPTYVHNILRKSRLLISRFDVCFEQQGMHSGLKIHLDLIKYNFKF